MAYQDPVTVPAADLAENPYWKRDNRRRYPQPSVLTQADAVALLQVGSAAQPKQDLIGEAGTKQLVAAREEGQKGLSAAFTKNTGLAKDVLGPGGMPPLPSGAYLTAGAGGIRQYKLDEDQSYPDKYVWPVCAGTVPADHLLDTHAGRLFEYSARTIRLPTCCYCKYDKISFHADNCHL